MKVKKRTLLLLASIVWLIAGFNIIRIGILSYTGHVTVVNILLSALVFAVFWSMVFYKLVIRHTDRIQNYEDELQFFWHFFDKKSFLIMAFMMNSSLAVIILIVIPVLTLSIVLILRTAFPRFTAMQEKLDRLNSGIQEALTNVRVIKSFVREGYEEEKFKGMNQDLKDSSLHAMKVVIVTMPVMMLAMNITTLAVVWYGGNLIIGGSMPVGDLTAFTTYIVQILMSLMMLSMVLLMTSRAIASVKRVNEVMDTKIDLTDHEAQRKELLVKEGRVEFENVSFSYSGREDELELADISFQVEPGRTLGIIGSTGSGKTTLVQLIPRLYDATKGRILVDGVDVRDYSLLHLREGVGMVLQKNVLFSGTIEENLKWGREDATEEELRQAAENAQADGFVTAFSEGYQTELGQGGSNVSGGQKQRLCIARALLKKPKILILDDSTSAVDTATEARIRETFGTELKSTTKIIIAQRIGSVEGADNILVLDEGRIIGQGSHEELLKSCSAYQEIYYSQRDKEETVPPGQAVCPGEDGRPSLSKEDREKTAGEEAGKV